MTSTTVHLAVLDTMADWEVGHLAAHLRHLGGQSPVGGFTLATVAARPGPVRTMGGLTVLPDLVLADLEPADSAMLVLPGGQTWMDPEVSGPFVDAARAHLAAGVPVAAVCGATWALAAAGCSTTCATRATTRGSSPRAGTRAARSTCTSRRSSTATS